MDRIVLEGIRALGRHGVSDDERAREQEFEVDVVCSTDALAASRTDHIGTTIDYRRLREIAIAEVEGPSHRLVETLAERIAARIVAELHPRWVRVRVTKLRPEGLGMPATVEVERYDIPEERGHSAPVELHVPDFEPAKRFYGALGLSVLREEAGDADGYLVMGNGVDVLRFWPGTAALREHAYFRRFPEDTPPGYGVEIVLTFADLDAAYERAKALGAVVEPIRARPWGLRDFRVADPFGYYVRCTEPHDVVTGARRRRSPPDHAPEGSHDEARPRDQRGERRPRP